MTDDFETPGHRRQRRFSWLLLGVAGVLAVLAVLWLWDGVRRIDAREALLSERIDALARREEALGVQAQAHATALSALTGAQGGITQRLEALDGMRRTGLLAGEAEFLVRLAVQRLALAQDAGGALTLLSAADAALRDIRDADVHAARAALAADSARLRQVAMIDIESVYLRLVALPPQVERMVAGLPVNGRDEIPATEAESLSGAAAENLSWWQRLQGVMSKLVNVRRVDTPLAPLVTRAEKQFAAQNFRLMIEQAQLALLQRQGTVYRHSLVQAGEWLDRVAAGDPQLRGSVRRELSSLQMIAPDAAMPDFGASLAATRALAVRLMPETGEAR